jgi:hypothetical protein
VSYLWLAIFTYASSCSQVSVKVIVMGEYVHIEGRYGKAFIKVSALFCRTPIHVFQMDED